MKTIIIAPIIAVLCACTFEAGRRFAKLSRPAYCLNVKLFVKPKVWEARAPPLSHTQCCAHETSPALRSVETNFSSA